MASKDSTRLLLVTANIASCFEQVLIKYFLLQMLLMIGIICFTYFEIIDLNSRNMI